LGSQKQEEWVVREDKAHFHREAPPYADLADDLEKASTNLASLMAEVAKKDLPTEGSFTEKGIRIRYALFGVSNSLVMRVTIFIKLLV
jgi:hypothetical protein